ncbi:MAG: GNAT family N-acetyltransferase [Solirubrobacterales bacterium]
MGTDVTVDAVRLEKAERRFRRDMWSVAPRDAVLEAGVRMRWFGPVFATVFADLPQAGTLNLIQGASEPGAVADGYLAEAVEWVQGWEVDFVVPVAQGHSEGALAEEWLQWHDYEQTAVVKRHACEPERLEPLGVADVEVELMPPCEDETLAILVADGLGLPDMAEILFIGLPCLRNWRCYLARIEGEPVATGSMMVDGTVATLSLDATREHARGRGCQWALIERRLADADAAGCRTVQAYSMDPCGEPSRATRNLRRGGFEEVGSVVGWRPARGTDFSLA